MRADIGIALDGDADRVILVDERGHIVDGDQLLAVIAQSWKEDGRLAKPGIVATVMSNLGLERFLEGQGIEMVRTPVGDRYVLDELRRRGWALGGEQSGHIILSREATTGDGLLTAMQVLAIVAASGRSLAQLVSGLKVFPQTIKNVRVKEKRPLEQMPEVVAVIRKAEQELHGNGRVNVRYSGTETLARVMVEAETEETVQRLAGQIAAALQAAIGADNAAAH
jgi:phosphoglucosamine mutase